MQKDTRNLLIVVAIIFLGFLGFVYFAMQNPIQVEPVSAETLVRPDSHMTGAKDTKYPVTIVEFGDIQCPACSFFHLMMLEIGKNYSGKYNFVFRHYPLSTHQHSMLAARAVEAANAQGRFWEMHDMLYENQAAWEKSSDPTGLFAGYAKEAGIDVEKFRADLVSGNFDTFINRDKSDGDALGITGTPSVFINGVKYQGALTYESFKKAVDQALAGVKTAPTE